MTRPARLTVQFQFSFSSSSVQSHCSNLCSLLSNEDVDMQIHIKKIVHITGVFIALFAIAGLATSARAETSHDKYSQSRNGYQNQSSGIHARFANNRRESRRVTVTIPMNGVYFHDRKTLKLKSLIKDYSQLRPRDYTLDRVILNAAFRKKAHHSYERESYAYLKTKRLYSERKQIPYARNQHRYPHVNLNVSQAVSADDWKLYIGPNVRIKTITLVLERKSQGHGRYARYQNSNYKSLRNRNGHDYARDVRQHWSEFANVRTKKQNRRDKQLRIPNGAKQLKLVGENRDTDILYAWVSYSDGRIQRLHTLQGTVRNGKSLRATIRGSRHNDVQATLHLVFKPTNRGYRSNLCIKSAL
jgi:hypothetical protein